MTAIMMIIKLYKCTNVQMYNLLYRKLVLQNVHLSDNPPRPYLTLRINNYENVQQQHRVCGDFLIRCLRASKLLVSHKSPIINNILGILENISPVYNYTNPSTATVKTFILSLLLIHFEKCTKNIFP